MSRLTEATKNIREVLISRNLYTPDNQYVLDNRQIVNTINSIATVLSPFKGYDVTNTVMGRVAFANTNSPLSQIGVIMLGKQFAHTVASNAQRNSLPTISFKNVLQGESIFNKNVDNSITVQAGQGTFSKLLQTLTTYSSAYNYPFNDYHDNNDYIKNTGSGQLKNFYEGFTNNAGINSNIYKQTDQAFVTLSSEKGFQIKSISTINSHRIWFNDNYLNTSNSNTYVTGLIDKNFPNAGAANYAFRTSINNFVTDTNHQIQEYGTTTEFIDSLGVSDSNSNIRNNPDLKNNDWISYDGTSDETDLKIVWGRDGVDNYANEVLAQLRSKNEIQLDGETSIENEISPNNDVTDKFNGDIGLLKFTSELLNASKGSFVDQTRKIFKSGNKLTGFNGSGLWTAPEGSLDRFVGKSGIRQHTALDQYDRFAKAIRFEGNIVYNGGNKNSVVNDTVMPRISPSLKNNIVDNKNLMFSIENLAVETIADFDTGVAYLKDEYATVIPISEVGSYNCRMMWFPPYGIELNEQSSAEWQTTKFIGRSEPVYTYNGSERTANLSFKLIMDYPPQLLAFRGDKNFHKRASEFFAFGGGSKPKEITNPSRDPLTIKKLQKQKEEYGTVNFTKPNTPPPSPSTIVSFPNDMPEIGKENDIFNVMYNDLNYEIKQDLNSTDGTNFGINEKFYNINEAEISFLPDGTWFKPYNTSINQYTTGNSKIDTFIRDYLDPSIVNTNGICNTKIKLVGSASKLYLAPKGNEYNLLLSKRRIAAVKKLITDKYKAIWGVTPEEVGIDWEEIATGSEGKSDAGALAENISERSVKEERLVTISSYQGGKSVNNPDLNFSFKSPIALTTKQDQLNLKALNDEINSKTQQTNSNSTKLTQYNGDVFTQMGDTLGPQKGLLSIGNNVFYPAFHSQTPDDFHNRLTFLQQCVRQGPSIKRTVNGDSLSSNNSAFGRPPICILRIGDFFFTKVIIDQVTINYNDSIWDLNPEGRGMQPMIAEVSLQMKVIGGQSLRGPIDALQNAVTFNYYANSTFSGGGTYATPTLVEALQYGDKEGIKTLISQKIEEVNAAGVKNQIFDSVNLTPLNEIL